MPLQLASNPWLPTTNLLGERATIDVKLGTSNPATHLVAALHLLNLGAPARCWCVRQESSHLDPPNSSNIIQWPNDHLLVWRNSLTSAHEQQQSQTRWSPCLFPFRRRFLCCIACMNHVNCIIECIIIYIIIYIHIVLYIMCVCVYVCVWVCVCGCVFRRMIRFLRHPNLNMNPSTLKHLTAAI